MGLINWLRDKAFLKLEHDVAILNTKIESLEMQLETLKGQIASVRAMKRNKLAQGDDEERSEGYKGLIDDVREAFGGDLPIEMQNYKRQ